MRRQAPLLAPTLGMSLGIALMATGAGSSAGRQDAAKGLTAVAGVKVGHHTLTARPTGCTVVLVEQGAVAGVDVRGSAPGTREIALLDPINTVQRVHGIVLAGGSAFGLDTATGVMRYLEEQDIGYPTRVAKVPIVPAAILFDLGVGDDPRIRPGPGCGYRAATSATAGVVAEGNVGAGAGATVGKLAGSDRAMKAGVGTAAIVMDDGLTVAALVAVNAVGDIIDPETGQIVAGVRNPDGSGLADVRRLLRSGHVPPAGGARNTTIGVVATNADLTKVEVTKVAQMAHDGLARAIVPAHTPADGDTLFALATGQHLEGASLLQIGALAADVVATAIVRAVRTAESIPGYPATTDRQP